MKTMDPKLKKWQCAHAWWEDAEFQVSILYINRLHRSGRWGEELVAQAEAWAKHCENLLDHAEEELGYDPR